MNGEALLSSSKAGRPASPSAIIHSKPPTKSLFRQVGISHIAGQHVASPDLRRRDAADPLDGLRTLARSISRDRDAACRRGCSIAMRAGGRHRISPSPVSTTQSSTSRPPLGRAPARQRGSLPRRPDAEVLRGSIAPRDGSGQKSPKRPTRSARRWPDSSLRSAMFPPSPSAASSS